jgi:PAS domain-containing protein
MTNDTPDTRPSPASDGSTRRWTHQLGDLQVRLRKMKNNGAAMAPAVLDLLDDALALSVTLLQELAGAQLHLKKLQADVRQSDINWHYLFDRLPTAALVTDSSGTIVSANRAAALLLNTSAKHLTSKLLLHFFDNREKFAATLQAAVAGDMRVEDTLTIRPKERAARGMAIVIVPESSEQTGHFLWFLTPASQPARGGLPVEAAGDQAMTA